MESVPKEEYGKIILRIGISLVFLWFGLNQIFDSESWTSYVPQFMDKFGIPPEIVILLNGILETAFGLLLLFGIFTRVASLILAIHLFFITLTLGYNEIAVRDLGLTFATLAVFFNGTDKFCIRK